VAFEARLLSDVSVAMKEFDPMVVCSLTVWADTEEATDSALIARGYLRDYLIHDEEGEIKIWKRQLVIEKIYVEGWLKPMGRVAEEAQDFFGRTVRKARKAIKQQVGLLSLLKGAREKINVFVAVAALLASTQPLVQNLSIKAGNVIAILGIVSAAAGVLIILINYGIKMLNKGVRENKASMVLGVP